MRVAVVGATGNLGTSALAALSGDPAIESIVGIARREPQLRMPKVTWRLADIASDPLDFDGFDAVVCAAWLIQPSRDEDFMERTNVAGNRRLFEAVIRAGVPRLVYISSVGAYGEGPKDRAVTESWPTSGIQSSYYSRHKAAVERNLDLIDPRDTAVVRLRPGLVFKREAGSGIRRLFAGPLLPARLLQRQFIPIVPDTPRLRFQAVHSLDVGEAIRLAVIRPVAGAFNLAADPVLDPAELARLLGARTVPIPAAALRTAAAVSWQLRLQPTSPGWLDLALGVPIMDSARARDELGWNPSRSAGEALLELLAGMRSHAGLPTPPLAPGTSGPLRIRELLGGIGSREIR